MNKRILSVLLVVALLVVGCLFAVQADETEPTPVNYDVPVSEQAKNGVYEAATAMDFSDANNLPVNCPYCGVETGIIWQVLPVAGTLTTGHYYVPEGGRITNTTYYNIIGKQTVCINLNGNDIISSAGTFRTVYSSGSPTLNIMGEGLIQGARTTGTYSVITSGGYLNLCGGTIKHASTSTFPSLYHNASTIRGAVNIYTGTTFTAGEGVTGGNVYLDVGLCNMYGGIIENGTAAANSGIPEFGGNVFVKGSETRTIAQVNTTFYMYGGQVLNGTAKNGGNIALGHLYGNCNLYLRLVGGLVSGGTATENGGNIYVPVWQNNTYLLSIDGCEVTGGTADKGGNVCVSMTPSATNNTFKVTACTIMLRDGKITNGTATTAGGNVYMSNVSKKHTVPEDSTNTTELTTFNVWVGGAIEIGGGSAPEGGNFYLAGTTALSSSAVADEYPGRDPMRIYGGKATGNGGNFYIEEGASFNQTFGTVEAGEAGDGLTASGSAQKAGGNFYVAGTLTVGANATVKDGRADHGGNIAVIGADAKATINGTITGGGAGSMGGTGIEHNTLAAISRKSAGQGGGNLYVDAGTATISGTMGELWETRDGANLFALNGAQVTLKDGAILDGGRASYNVAGAGGRGEGRMPTARYEAGNILADGEGTLVTIETGAIVRNGMATDHASTSYGGNVQVRNNATVTMNGGEISGGQANQAGGNVHVKSGTFNLNGGTISGGSTGSDDGGGNVYVNGGTLNIAGGNITGGSFFEDGAKHNYSANIYQTAGTINHTAGTVSGGTGTNGGNVMILGNTAKYILNGGTVEGGYASSHGNNLYLRAGTLELLSGTINNNTTETEGDSFEGNSVYIGATTHKTVNLVIGGDMTINAGDYLSDIYMNTNATGLVIKDDFTGDVHIAIAGASANPIIRPSDGYYGYHIGSEYEKISVDDKNTDDTADDEVLWTTNGTWGAEGAYIGKLTLQTSKTTSVSIFPEANGATEGNTHDLVIASVRGTKTVGEETVQTWYPNAEAAIDGGDDYFALFTDAAFEIAEGKTAFVNINGKDVTVSGAGELTFFDAATAKGAVTVDGVTLVNNSHNGKLVKNPQNITYLTYTNEDGTYSSYKLKVELTGVSLRPYTAGIYFRSLVTTEVTGTAAEEMIQGFGVVVSRYAQPDANFVDDPDHMWWTEYTAADLDGEQKTGVEVTGIFKEGQDNASRGTTPVYAAAYATVWNGAEVVTIIDEEATTGYSMYDVLNMMEDSDTVWPAYADALNAFYNTWAADLGAWEFDRLGQ